jgi:hypothetical protein
VGQRFVEQERPRHAHQRAADAGEARLAGRERAGHPRQQAGEPEQPAAGGDPALGLRCGHAVRARRAREVGGDVEERHEGGVVEDHRHVALRRGDGRDVLPGDVDPAALHGLQPGDRPERGGLPAPGRPDDREHLPRIGQQRHPAQGGTVAAEGDGDVQQSGRPLARSHGSGP